MKINRIGEPQIIMSNPESLHKYFAWPTVTKLKNGELMAGASGFRLGHICPFGKVAVVRSCDDGKTWTNPEIVIDTVLDDRDAGLCPFGESGLIVTSFNNTVAQQRAWAEEIPHSEERKKYITGYLDTVSAEKEKEVLGATFKISYDNGKTFGKTYVSPITSPHGPIELADGTILWVGTDDFAGSKQVYAYKLNLDGTMEKLAEFENPKELSSEGKECFLCEPYAFQDADGTIICHLRSEPNFTIYQSVSKDSGKTWSKPEMILPEFGGAPSHIMRHSSGVLIAATGYRGNPYGIDAMFSEDGGKTWDKGHRIYEQEFSWDLGYPSTVELSDGSLLTVFYACPGYPNEETQPVIMQQRWSFEK